MARKPKQKVADAPAGFSEDLTLALEKIGETELRALIFGYLHAKGQLNVQPSPPTTAEVFPNFLDDAVRDKPTFTSLGPEAVAPLDSVFREGDLQTYARSPHRDIVECIEGVLFRHGKPYAKTAKPSEVSVDRYQWTILAQEIFLCVARKYPKFAPHAKPSNADKFFEVSFDVLAQAIFQVAV